MSACPDNSSQWGQLGNVLKPAIRSISPVTAAFWNLCVKSGLSGHDNIADIFEAFWHSGVQDSELLDMLERALRFLLPVSLIGIVAMTSAAAPAESQDNTPSASEQAVLAFEAEVKNAYNGGDAALAARHYASDALVYIPGQPVRHGRDAIESNIARFMQDANFKLGYVNEQVSVAASNDLARSRGKLRVTYTDRKTRSARTTISNYLLVMRRDPQAGWQVVEDLSF